MQLLLDGLTQLLPLLVGQVDLQAAAASSKCQLTWQLS
jgi:hypothetical protein